MTSATEPQAKLPFIAAFVLAVLAGYSILMFLPHNAPAEGMPPPVTWYQSVQAAVRTAIRMPTGILLFLCGLGLGWVHPRHWFFLGLSTLAILPVAAIADLAGSGKAPPVWMLVEFVMFFCMALPALAGAAIGKMIRYKGLPPSDSAIL